MTVAEAPHPSGAPEVDEGTRLLAEFLDGFGEGCVVLGRDWRVLLINRAAEAQGVANGGRWLGQSIWKALPELVGAGLEDWLRKGMADRAPQETEVGWPLKPGADFCIKLFPVRPGVGVSFRDVTAENALRARERDQARQLDFLLAATDLGVVYWDLASDEMTLSPQAAEILGVAPQRQINRRVFQSIQDPEEVARTEVLYKTAIETGEALEISVRIKRAVPGDERWAMVRIRAQYDTDGRPTGFLGVVADITRLKAQEAQIRESEARFRAFANCTPTPLWVTSADGRVEFINQAGADFFGRTVEAYVGQQPDMEGFHPEDGARVFDLAAQAWARREPYEYVARRRGEGGRWRWVRTINHPRRDQDGTFLGYIGVCMDITEVQEAEARQRMLVNELNHRVKNTLATVQSIASQTLRPGLEPRVAKASFVERLLTLSAAHNVLNREHWGGADLMEIAAAVVAPYGGDGRIGLRGAAARLEPNVAVALSMALHELATNAAKYGALSDSGGQASLVWGVQPDGGGVRLRWRERNGPPVSSPAQSGFGHRLLIRGLAAELGAPASLEFRKAGLICTITAPIMQGAPASDLGWRADIAARAERGADARSWS